MPDLIRMRRPARRHPAEERRGCTAASLRAEALWMSGEAVLCSAVLHGALVLVAGLRVGANVVRLSRLTGLSAPLVSQIARRCYDNGVWHEGGSFVSWTCGQPDPTFLLDARVAAGELLRRHDEHGMVEWAAPGEWRKNYDFVQREATGANRYHEAAPDVEPPTPLPGASLEVEAEEDEEMASVSGDGTGRSRSRGPSRVSPPIRHRREGAAVEGSALESPRTPGARPRLTPTRTPGEDLFPGASWLG